MSDKEKQDKALNDLKDYDFDMVDYPEGFKWIIKEEVDNEMMFRRNFNKDIPEYMQELEKKKREQVLNINIITFPDGSRFNLLELGLNRKELYLLIRALNYNFPDNKQEYRDLEEKIRTLLYALQDFEIKNKT